MRNPTNIGENSIKNPSEIHQKSIQNTSRRPNLYQESLVLMVSDRFWGDFPVSSAPLETWLSRLSTPQGPRTHLESPAQEPAPHRRAVGSVHIGCQELRDAVTEGKGPICCALAVVLLVLPTGRVASSRRWRRVPLNSFCRRSAGSQFSC